MRPIGFSTGALTKGDYRRGIDLQTPKANLRAIELSALRDYELAALTADSRNLDLAHFRYVSFHAPSKLSSLDEKTVFDRLKALPHDWPIIVHPELIRTPELWRSLGRRLCLENMDNRKTAGRTVAEMRELLNAFPDAEFCLDLAHARQIDPTMATALRMLQEFGPRLRQLHVSEIGPQGDHRPLSGLAIYAFQLVAHLVPEDCPVIIESVIPPEEMDAEIQKNIGLFGLDPPKVQRSLLAAIALVG
jgi:hypothetical protein